MRFTGYQTFAYLFVIILFSVLGVLNILWSWILPHWTTSAIAPYFLKLSVLLTLAGAMQLILTFIIFASSYFVENHRKTYNGMVIGSTTCMLVVVVPLCLAAARSPGDFRNVLLADMQAAVINNRSNGILNMTYQKFNCCGIASEPTCSKTYPPFLNGITPCHQGSELCAKDCFEIVWQKLVDRYEIVGWVLADISFAVSIAGPILLLTAVFKDQSCMKFKGHGRQFSWRKFMPRSVSSAYTADKRDSAAYETIPKLLN